MEILGHCAHDVEAFVYLQGFCSSRENDFSISDGNFLPTPDIESPKLHWLRVVYLSPCFCEDNLFGFSLSSYACASLKILPFSPKLPPTGCMNVCHSFNFSEH